jgi:hypothetical protein
VDTNCEAMDSKIAIYVNNTWLTRCLNRTSSKTNTMLIVLLLTFSLSI